MTKEYDTKLPFYHDDVEMDDEELSEEMWKSHRREALEELGLEDWIDYNED